MKRWLVDRGGALVLATLVLYLWLAPAHIVDGDNAELATLGALGGAAHPPGYPLYILYLRAMAWLPGSSPAHTAALATALLGAAQIGVLHAACRAWGARPLAASLAVALYATSPIALREYTQADVFALNGLAIAAVLWLAAADGPLRGHRRAVALGLVAGLGLANNPSCVLIAPVGLYGVWLAWREARATAAALAIAGLAVGLAPYAYLLVARDGPGTWGAAREVGDVLAMFTRRDYGTTSLSARGLEVSIGARLIALAADVGRAWLWLPLAGGLAVLGARLARPAWLALAAAVVLTGPIFALRLNVPADGFGAWLLPRFHLMAILVLAIPVAAALDHVVERIAQPVLRGALVALAFVAPTALALPWLARVHGATVEAGVLNLLRALPKDAVVIATPDDLQFGATYVQEVLGERRDVTVIIWQMLRLPWYRARIEARGIALGAEPIASVRVAEALLARGVPLYVDTYEANILGAFPSVPAGTVFHVLAKGTPLPPIAQVVADNKAIFGRFLLGETPRASDDVAAIVFARYAQTWQILAEALDAAGQASEARAAAAIAQELNPL